MAETYTQEEMEAAYSEKETHMIKQLTGEYDYIDHSPSTKTIIIRGFFEDERIEVIKLCRLSAIRSGDTWLVSKEDERYGDRPSPITGYGNAEFIDDALRDFLISVREEMEIREKDWKKDTILGAMKEYFRIPKAKYYGFTYCLPQLPLLKWLWKRIFCKRNWHLFDETSSVETGHSLYCDACKLSVYLDDEKGIEHE